MLKIQPLNRHLVIEVQKVKTIGSGALELELPEGSQGALEEAPVVAIDPAIEGINVGDTVYYKLYSLSTIEIDGKEYAFIPESEVLAKQ